MNPPLFGDEPDATALGVPGGVPAAHGRPRFVSFTFRRTQSAYCTAIAELEGSGGERFSGKAEGVSNPVSDLRLAVEATLRAVVEFSRVTLRLELLGVKALRVFDANIVIVSVLARRGDSEVRLLGAHLADDDVLRGAALATLQATNRMASAALPS